MPELEWLKGLAGFAQATGPYGIIAALIYVVKLQRDELKHVRDALDVKDERRVEELKSLLAQVIALITTANDAMKTGADVTTRLSSLVQSAIEIMRMMPTQYEQTTKALDRNYEKMDQIFSRIHSIGARS